MEKYVFFDIDGTLLPEGEKVIPKRNIDALNKLKENGVKVFVCTGRCYSQAKTYIDQVNGEGFVVSNGQEANLRGEEVYSYNLSEEEVKYLKEKLEQSGAFWGFETRDSIYLQEKPGIDKVREELEQLANIKTKKGVIEDGHLIKQMWSFGNCEEITNLEKEIIDKFKFFRWGENSMEIIPLEESKAKAVQKILDKVDGEVKTYAFGDSYNDLELLSLVNTGVAMGNACPELKAVANYTTTNCTEDGIEKALKYLGLI